MRLRLDDVQQEITDGLRPRLTARGEVDAPTAADIRGVLADLDLYRLELPGDVGGLQYGLACGAVICGELGRAGCTDDYRAAAFLADLAAAAGTASAQGLLLALSKEPPAVAVAAEVVNESPSPAGPVLHGRVALTTTERAARWIAVRVRGAHGLRWAAVAVGDRGMSGEGDVTEGGVTEGGVTEGGVTLEAATDLLGEQTATGRSATAVHRARVRQAAYLVGLATGAHHHALGYGKRRRQFGRPIGEHQSVMFGLARQFAELEAARLLMHRAAWLADNGVPLAGPAAEALAYASETARECLRLAMQVHGAYGLTLRAPVSRYYLAGEPELVRWGRPVDLWREASALRRAAAEVSSQPPR